MICICICEHDRELQAANENNTKIGKSNLSVPLLLIFALHGNADQEGEKGKRKEMIFVFCTKIDARHTAEPEEQNP